MKDIQSQQDNRKIDIRKVGVKTISYPITVLDKAQSKQSTVASVNMFVNLPHLFKGTHMSRFVEILSECHGRIDFQNFQFILEQMKEKLHAEASHLEMYFPYFLQNSKSDDVSLPVSYKCGLHGSLEKVSDIKLSLEVPVFNRSAEIDDKSLWGRVELKAGFNKFYWIEDVIELIENEIAIKQAETTVNKQSLSDCLLADKIASSLEQVEEIREFNITVHRYNARFTSFSRVSGTC